MLYVYYTQFLVAYRRVLLALQIDWDNKVVEVTAPEQMAAISVQIRGHATTTVAYTTSRQYKDACCSISAAAAATQEGNFAS